MGAYPTRPSNRRFTAMTPVSRFSLLVFAIFSTDAATATPAGWVVAIAPQDSGLVGLSQEELISQLTKEGDQGPEVRRATELGPFLPLDTRLAEPQTPGLRSASPAMVEIERRGCEIIPCLLKHLTDSRPTGLTEDSRRLHLNGSGWTATNIYDYRSHVDTTQPLWEQRQREHIKGDPSPYGIKVGDLCYVALGRIVNRRLYVSGPDFGNGMVFSGAFSLLINSPVEVPELAAAARSDWDKVTPKAFAAWLSNEASTRDPWNRQPVENQPWIPPIDRQGALIRLMFYFPEEGLPVAEQMLARPMQRMTDTGPPQWKFVTDAEQTNLVRGLAAFHCERLDAAVWELFIRSVAEETGFLAETPVEEHSKLNYRELSLACAEFLLHRGHDDELRLRLLSQTQQLCREFPGVVAAFTAKVKESMAADASSNSQAMKLPPEMERQREEMVVSGVRSSLKAPLQKRVALLNKLGVRTEDLAIAP